MSDAFTEQADKLISRISHNLKSKKDNSFDLFNIESVWNELDLGEVVIKKADKWIKISIEKGLDSAAEVTGVSLDIAGSQAIKDAQADILKMIKSLTDRTSIEKMRAVIIDSFGQNDTVQDLTKKIRAEFDQYSQYRAEMISRTESANAYGRASQEYYRETGIKYKRWQTMEDDIVAPECWENQNQGVIAIDAPFSSGRMNEPNHPNCRCSVIPVAYKD